jgi:hypothetical protein
MKNKLTPQNRAFLQKLTDGKQSLEKTKKDTGG